MFTTTQAAALPFINGDFDAGLVGWVIDGNTSLNTAQVDLSTIGVGGLFSDASLAQGDFFSGPDTIQLGATDNFLNFDVWYQDLGPDGNNGSGPPFDNLLVALLDELDFNLDLFFDSEFDFLFGAPFASVSLDISSLAGRSVGLYFDVFNEDDGRHSLFTIDNVSFSETRSVPEPGILFLLLPGIMLFASRYKQNKIY